MSIDFGAGFLEAGIPKGTYDWFNVAVSGTDSIDLYEAVEGKEIFLLGFAVTFAASVNITLRSATTTILGPLYLSEGIVLPKADWPSSWCHTDAGEALTGLLSADVNGTAFGVVLIR